MSRTRKPSPLPFPAKVPFVEAMGLELHACGNGRSDVRVDIDEAHLNAWEVAHGGVVMTLLDVAMAMAARSTHPQGQGVATLEMKTSFMRAAEGRLRAEGRVLHQTATLAFCAADLHDDTGQLCASASGTFKYLRAMPARGRTVRPAAFPGAPAPHDQETP